MDKKEITSRDTREEREDGGETIPAGTYYLNGEKSKDYLIVGEDHTVKDSRIITDYPEECCYLQAMIFI